MDPMQGKRRLLAQKLFLLFYHRAGRLKRGGEPRECPKEDLKEIKEGERNRRGMIAGAV